MRDHTIAGLSRELAARRISSVEAAQHFLRRIKALNDRYRCFITVDEAKTLAQAQAADRRLASGRGGPLTGIPIAQKDIFCAQGWLTTCGSKMLANFVSPYDAHVVERLNAAGARKIMDTAITRAKEAKLAVTIAVVDAGGHLMLLERMEGGKFHTVHSATTKAVCAASNKRATGSQGAVGQALDTAHALGLALAAGPERWTAMEGGWPIMAGEECIGGVGVAGGNWEFDERVAREAAESIK